MDSVIVGSGGIGSLCAVSVGAMVPVGFTAVGVGAFIVRGMGGVCHGWSHSSVVVGVMNHQFWIYWLWSNGFCFIGARAVGVGAVVSSFLCWNSVCHRC